MIVTLKNLQQGTFTIEIDAAKTVRELKEEIFKKLGGEYVVEKQKLIYSGVILLDDRSLASYNVEEHKFVVVLITRGNKQTAEESNPIQVNDSGTETRDFVTDVVHETINTAPQNIESEFVNGEEYSRSVNALVEMGFSRELVERAMAASFNNPARAFEYLTDGIPDLPDTLQTDNNENRNSINEFLELLRQNPTILRAALEQIGLTDASLIQRIVDHPDTFFNLLTQPVDSAMAQTDVSHERLRENTGVLNNMAQNGENQSNTRSAAGETNRGNEALVDDFLLDYGADFTRLAPSLFTSDELFIIERIKAMGFSEEAVIQAFIVCDKDEQLTINFLLSNPQNEF